MTKGLTMNKPEPYIEYVARVKKYKEEYQCEDVPTIILRRWRRELGLSLPGKKSKIKVELNNEVKSIPRLSDETGIPKEVLYYRYRKGIRGEDLINTESLSSRTIRVKYKGELITLNQLAEKIGIQKDSLYSKLREGSEGVKLTKEVKSKAKILIEYNNEFKTVEELSRELGIPKSTLYYRIRNAAKKNNVRRKTAQVEIEDINSTDK
jgi:transposase-like protein